jgi:prevent-host-death family protein
MKTVNIGTLKNKLSAYLQDVRNGEEVIVQDRKKPIARIVPCRPAAEGGFTEEELYLASIGVMKLPENPKPMDWDAFWKLPTGNVSREAAQEAIDWAKGE